jgi:hypothetical protein
MKILYILLLLFTSVIHTEEVYQTTTLLDFEKSNPCKVEVVEKLEQPQTFISSINTHPQLESEKSLAIRIPPAIHTYPIKILCAPVTDLTDFVKSFHLHVYSNHAGGTLSILVNDQFSRHIKLGRVNLTFEGWQKFTIPANILQQDYTISQPQWIQWIGFVYEPIPNSRLDKELLIYIDDVQYTHRKKFMYNILNTK